MPLFEDRIVVITDNNRVRWIGCNHCQQIGDLAQTIGDFPFQIMCPAGRQTLGEFRTEAERQRAIDGFLD